MKKGQLNWKNKFNFSKLHAENSNIRKTITICKDNSKISKSHSCDIINFSSASKQLIHLVMKQSTKNNNQLLNTNDSNCYLTNKINKSNNSKLHLQKQSKNSDQNLDTKANQLQQLKNSSTTRSSMHSYFQKNDQILIEDNQQFSNQYQSLFKKLKKQQKIKICNKFQETCSIAESCSSQQSIMDINFNVQVFLNSLQLPLSNLKQK